MDRRARAERASVAATGCLAMIAVFSGAACEERAETTPTTADRSRFAAVARGHTVAASASFCDVAHPPSAANAPKFTPPPERSIPGARAPETGSRAPDQDQGWRWVNFWASWCGPCLREMPLLRRWRDSLRSDGVELNLDFYSVDEEESALIEAMSPTDRFPGTVRWISTPDAAPELFRKLGIEAGAPIPVHILVDPGGVVRCVRVGEVREELYGTVRAILSKP